MQPVWPLLSGRFTESGRLVSSFSVIRPLNLDIGDI